MTATISRGGDLAQRLHDETRLGSDHHGIRVPKISHSPRFELVSANTESKNYIGCNYRE